ncbi:hypothetical protein OG21DRAFT_1200456 [Imleria badia]|nr:hypothetical protein OG21DRAFT_1200456 [Imleria badia]
MGTLKRSARSIKSSKNSLRCFVSRFVIKRASKQSTTMHAGEIGFKLSKGRLPWSTLEGDLQKKGYMIVNWPQGVDREKDKGVFGISAEDADKLYEALFVGDHRIRFILCEGELLSLWYYHLWVSHPSIRICM